MWISRHRFERMEETLRKLESQVYDLQRNQFYDSTKEGDIFPTVRGERDGIPLYVAVNQLARKIGLQFRVTPASWAATVATSDRENAGG